MKTVPVITTYALAAFSALATELPTDFKVFFSNNITPEISSMLRFEDDELILADGTKISAVTVKRTADLNLREAQPDKTVKYAAAVGAIYAGRPQTLRIGMGADWWFDCYCNGKYIYGTTDSGNGSWPPRSTDYIFDLPLRAGRNDLVIFTRSGVGGWNLVMDVQNDSKEVNLPKLSDVKPKIVFGPYLTNPGNTTATISCVVRGRQPLELQYRKKGESIWQKKQILRGGQLLDEGPVMRFDLENLQPGSIYEYRLLKRTGPDLRTAEPGAVQEFRTFDKKGENFSFWIMADTHKSKIDKLAMLQQLLNSRPELQKADMFVHLGDISSNMDDIELALFDSFLKGIPAHQPIVAVRGNHEFDGEQAGRYMKYLGSREHKSYQAFKLGNIFFIALDTGHHLPKDSTNSFQKYTGLNELDTLLAEQTLWLQEVVKTPEFRNADCRIVFAHVAPHAQVDSFKHMIPRLQKMTAPLFKGSPAKYPVDLWFAGHTHVYKVAPADKNWQFPVLIPGGGARKAGDAAAVLVKVKNNTVYLETIHSNGTTNDRFVLNTKVKPAVLEVVKTLP